MTGDDDRRAEIEAAIEAAMPEMENRFMWAASTGNHPDATAEGAVRTILEPLLDRVRDARGDDDEAARAAAQHREDTSKLVAAGVRITELENEVERLHARLQRWEAGLAATEELQLVRDARRDDEAGIEAAARELGRWRPVNDTAMVARVVVDAYLLEMRGGERDG